MREVKIEGSPKEIADLLQRLQDQQFKNGVYSLGDTTVTEPYLHGEGIAQTNGFAR